MPSDAFFQSIGGSTMTFIGAEVQRPEPDNPGESHEKDQFRHRGSRHRHFCHRRHRRLRTRPGHPFQLTAFTHQEDQGTPRDFYAEFKQDEGTPRDFYAEFKQDEGTPQDFYAQYRQDEGTPRDFYAQFKQDEGTPRDFYAQFKQDEGTPRDFYAEYKHKQDEGTPQNFVA